MKRPILIFMLISVLGIILLTVVKKPARKAPVSPFECSDAIGCVTLAPGAPLKLGLMQDMSGSAVIFGTDQMRSMEIAVARREGRFLNHPIVLLKEDSMCSPEGARVAASKFASDPDVVGVLGPTCSASAAAAGKIITDAGMVLVSGLSTAPSLTSVEGKPGMDWNRGFFRTSFNVTETSRGAAMFAFNNLGIKKTATVNDGDTFTKGYADTFKNMFEKLGGEIVLEATVNKGETHMGPVLAAVAASGAELLFFPVFEREAVFIVRQAETIADLEHIILFGINTVLTDSFIKATGMSAKGTYILHPAPPPGNAAIEELISEFEIRYGEAPKSLVYDYGFDAVNLLLNAIGNVAIRGKDGTLDIGRQALRNALRGTTDFKGITGTLACDDYGDCGATRYHVVRLDDPGKGIEGLKANIIYRQTD